MSTARNTRNGSRKAAPKPRPTRSDLDALAAEATFEPFPFKWQGREWTLQHQQLIDTWDVIREGEDLTQNQQILELFQIALGDQWEEFKAIPLPLHLLESLFEDYNAYCGTEPGEDERSAGS